MLPVIGALRPWTDPTVLQLNRLAMHTPLSGFTRVDLDGDWRLEMFDDPDSVPEAALQGARRRAVTTAVPGNWTMQDLGDFEDLPQYTNIRMPFPGPPPLLPERNPTGVYRRAFDVPAAWQRRRTVLHVAGAESVHAVYVNGVFTGYGTDSRLPSEYDLSERITAGRNELAIVVVRFSAHSYIEDQDQWWMAGLHRSVWLESRPPVHLADVPVTTDYDPATGQGTVSATPAVDFHGEPAPGWVVRAMLTGPNGKRVGRTIEEQVPHLHRRPYEFTGFDTTVAWTIRSAKAWSAETPHLYTLSMELVDPRGRVVHTETQRIGLKRVEVCDRQLLLNGKRIWIFGVNRHDHHPDRGKAVTVDDMRADLLQMRRHNISAIRTSHYPNDTEFYDLCDELGFVVVDEANIESHAYNWSLCDDPTYRAAWVDRGARMVQRDRNHPCIILWSLGNESGYGTGHDALAAWIRRTDPTRPLHYEDAIRTDGWVDGGLPATDVVCPMYPEIAEIRAYGASGEGSRPLIMCEYSHAMGNSNGSLADYWEAFTSTPGLQGGFIWEWKDHGLRQSLPDGTVRVAYGGQFGEELHDGNFVADGLVSADLDPHPAMQEVAWVHRPVAVTRIRAGLRVENRQSFSDLRDLVGEWEYQVGGEVREHGRLQVPTIAPLTAETVPMPIDLPGRGVADAQLTVRWRLRHDAWFAPAGHLVAWDQLELRAPRRPAAATRTSPPVTVEPSLDLWRAPVDNDGFKLMSDLARRIGVGGQALASWSDAGLHAADPETLVDHVMRVSQEGPATLFRHVVDVPETLDDLPRIGVQFAVPVRFAMVKWFGRGPEENYPDRNAGALVGVWEARPDECPYLVPQEYGLRTECRWMELLDPDSGDVLRIEAVAPATLHMSAIPHTAADLFEAATATELRRREHLTVHVDVAHRGLGTASCGPDVLARYRIAPGRHEFSYRITG